MEGEPCELDARPQIHDLVLPLESHFWVRAPPRSRACSHVNGHLRQTNEAFPPNMVLSSPFSSFSFILQILQVRDIEILAALFRLSVCVGKNTGSANHSQAHDWQTRVRAWHPLRFSRCCRLRSRLIFSDRYLVQRRFRCAILISLRRCRFSSVLLTVRASCQESGTPNFRR